LNYLQCTIASDITFLPDTQSVGLDVVFVRSNNPEAEDVFKEESLADANLSAQQPCVYEGP